MNSVLDDPGHRNQPLMNDGSPRRPAPFIDPQAYSLRQRQPDQLPAVIPFTSHSFRISLMKPMYLEREKIDDTLRLRAGR